VTKRLSVVQGTQEIDPSEITICQLEDGRPWLLGSGSFGQVCRDLLAAHASRPPR